MIFLKSRTVSPSVHLPVLDLCRLQPMNEILRSLDLEQQSTVSTIRLQHFTLIRNIRQSPGMVYGVHGLGFSVSLYIGLRSNDTHALTRTPPDHHCMFV